MKSSSSSSAPKSSAAPPKKTTPPPTSASKTPPPIRHPPKFVYRADTREPKGDVFVKGFTAAGIASEAGVDDLLAHVRGGAALSETVYISTSQSRRIPAAFIKEKFKANGSEDAIIDSRNPEIKYKRREGWIYEINTSGLDMVYVPDFLHDHQKELKQFGYQQEWAIKGSVPAKNIKDAQHVDGYIYRYSDFENMRQGVDALYPPDKNPFSPSTEQNPKYVAS